MVDLKGGNVECVKLLLQKSENNSQKNELFTKDNNNEAPAFTAVIDGKPEVLDFMLQQMDSKTKEEFYGTRSSGPQGSYAPIAYIREKSKHGAISSKEHQQAFKVLVSHLNKDDSRLYTAWLYAAKHDDIEMGKTILGKATNEEVKQQLIGYQATHYSDGFHTALHECAERNSAKFLEWLLSIISEDNEMFTKTSYSGYTPLMVAASKTHMKCVTMMLNKLKNDRKRLNEILKLKDRDDNDIIRMCLLYSNHKNKVYFIFPLI